ncbi:MAG: Extracellular ligand-binding receptor [Thermomicrobiales bacterium]|nr:Extracellular ligand-binding receptor [Thermomicrobiales bacterium]
MLIDGYRQKTSAVRSAHSSCKWNLRVVTALILIVPLLATLLGPSARAQDEAGPLRIAVLFPFTGDLSDFGPPFLQAAELAVNEINAAGGVNGQPIELVQGDSATSPQQAVEEARRLIELEGVSAIVGPAGSGETLPVAESVTGPSGVLEVTMSATSPALTIANDNDFLFRTTISDAAQGLVMADLAREQGYDSACVLYVNNAYGQGLSDAFAERFIAQGGTVTAQVPSEQEQASYASEVAACTEGDPDVLVAPAYPESARVFLRELVESGDAPDVIFSDGLKSPEMFADLGWDVFEGSFGTAAGTTETDAGTAFDQAWEEAYGDVPAVPYLREINDAIYLIALAAEKAGSTDPTAMRDALREVANEPGTVVGPGPEGWSAAVESVAAGEDVNYEGATGPADLDENGDVAVGSILIWKVEGGEIIDVETRHIDLTEAAAATPVATPAA